MSTTTSQSDAAHDISTSRWRIDPARSSVEFNTRGFWGLATTHGAFTSYEGTLDLRRDPAIELTIDAGSLNTKNGLRDRHLRSGQFFDVKNHPQVRFVSDSATLDGERLTVHGRLHAAGQSMPLELEATLRRLGQDELEVDGHVEADHHQLGMTHSPLGMVRTPSELIVHGRLMREPE